MAARPEAGGGRSEGGWTAALGAAGWLGLAAAPTFALMTVLTAITGDGHGAMLCLPDAAAPPLSGMATMYALMTAFHLGPWLRQLARRAPTAAGGCGVDVTPGGKNTIMGR